jgi:hypothetical protein
VRAPRRKGADISLLQKLETSIVNSESPIDDLTKFRSSGITIEFRALPSATVATMMLVFDRFRDVAMQKFDNGKQFFFRPLQDR